MRLTPALATLMAPIRGRIGAARAQVLEACGKGIAERATAAIASANTKRRLHRNLRVLRSARCLVDTARPGAENAPCPAMTLSPPAGTVVRSPVFRLLLGKYTIYTDPLVRISQ